MSHYLDTSVVVAALVEEPATFRVRTWLETRKPGDLVISDWVVAEVSSALSIKLRTGQIDLELRTAALGVFRRLRAEELAIAPIQPTHFQAATDFSDRPELAIRAGDALHLAISRDLGATLATLDRTQASAAPALGIKALLL